MLPKFRVWDKKHEVICEVLQIHFDLGFVNCFNEWIRNLYFDDCILMQSTGLKDKNGVEIFEGDILTDEGDFGHDFWDYGEVVFDEDEFTYLINWESENICESITVCGDYSIAGNIYENKELLED